MKAQHFALVSFISILVSYQNCSQPIQDLSTELASTTDCPVAPGQASINEPMINGNQVRLDIFTDEEVDRIRWQIGTNVTETNAPFLISTLGPGDYIVRVTGLRNNCSVPVYTASRNITINGPTPCDTVATVSTASNAILVNSDAVVSLSNANLFQASSIRWRLNGVEKPEWNGQAQVTHRATAAGSLEFAVEATANCGANKNATLTVTVNAAATNPASLTDFKFTPLSSGTNPIRGTGLSAVYKIERANGKKLSLQIANKQSIQTDLTTATGCQYPDCFNFDVVTASGSCQYIEKAVNATGTNNAVTAMQFFIYCPINQTFCHAGLLANRLETEICSGCGVNLYIPTNGTSCQPVGDGFYSPAGSNTRSACTNTKPSNSYYSGPGANGTNNCPWTCSVGYQLENGQCVAQQVTCQAANIGSCSFYSSTPGMVIGDCQTNPSCMCTASCSQNGTLELSVSTCPGGRPGSNTPSCNLVD